MTEEPKEIIDRDDGKVQMDGKEIATVGFHLEDRGRAGDPDNPGDPGTHSYVLKIRSPSAPLPPRPAILTLVMHDNRKLKFSIGEAGDCVAWASGPIYE